MKNLTNVRWNKGNKNHKFVQSEIELIALIKDLATKAKDENYPITLEIKGDEDTVLSLVVGLDISVLHFYNKKSEPQYFTSEGEISSDKWVAFYMQDHFSEIPLKYFIPIDLAIEAVKEYYHSGQKPTNIKWVT